MSAYFVVQSFSRGKKGGVIPDIPVQATNTGHARRMAEQLSLQKAAVIAFMREGDPKTGEFEDAKLITALGDVPDEIYEMENVN